MLSIYHTSLQEYLSPEQIVLLEMLVRVIQIFKEIKIEKLAGRLPIPIKFESRRKAIQRFLLERAMPIYWEFLDKKGCSNLGEQQQVLRPVFELFAEYQIFLLGDREFRGVHLTAWLTQLKIKYVFRIKGDTWVEKKNGQLCLVNKLECKSGYRYFHESIKLTKIKGFGYSNLAIYWKRKYRGKQPKEA